MRDKSVLRKLLGLCVSTVVVVGRELLEGGEGGRDRLDVWVRTKVGVPPSPLPETFGDGRRSCAWNIASQFQISRPSRCKPEFSITSIGSLPTIRSTARLRPANFLDSPRMLFAPLGRARCRIILSVLELRATTGARIGTGAAMWMRGPGRRTGRFRSCGGSLCRASSIADAASADWEPQSELPSCMAAIPPLPILRSTDSMPPEAGAAQIPAHPQAGNQRRHLRRQRLRGRRARLRDG